MTTSADDEFQPSAGARSTMRWAHEMGASTLGDAYDMLDQLGIELMGTDTSLADLL